MFSLVVASLLFPLAVDAAIQCYVGQKLFSMESNMAVCAPFIPYHCAAACEWRSNCTSHVSYDLFDGRRTFVSGVLINGKSMMLLCCASLSTQVQADRHGERCAWRDPDSVPVLGPSLRADPVLGVNHYIREIRMERDGDSRVDVQLEVCQYEREYEQCKEEKMADHELVRFNQLRGQLDAAKGIIERREQLRTSTTPSPTTAPASSAILQKIVDEDREKRRDECASVITSECGKNIHGRIMACCADLSACDRACLKGVERSLLDELIRNERGCSTKEVRQTLDCLARKVATRVSH